MCRILIIAILFFIHLSALADSDRLVIVNIRVGQGDATLIQGPIKADGSRVNVLVDAGDRKDRDAGNIIRTVLWKRGVTMLDYVVISHYDADHIGGIVTGPVHGVSFLLGWDMTPGLSGDDDGDGNDGWVGDAFFVPDPEEFGQPDDMPVGHFVDRGDVSPPSSQAYQKYIHIAEAHNNRISLDDKDDVEGFEIDLGDGAKMEALAANGFVRDRSTRVANVNTENERSISMLLTYRDFDYLISGDLIGRQHGSENAKVEKAVGEYIASQDRIIDVLHANHHGANNGSEESFLASIKPTIAIISAGNGNSHEHPDKDALKRLEEAGVYRIIQTSWGTTEEIMPLPIRDIQAIYQNDVVVTTDGFDFEVSTSRKFAVDDNPRVR